MHLTYPTIDSLARLVHLLGPGCLMYKKDLKHAFRWVPVDTADYRWLGVCWREGLYFNTVLPMGMVTSSFIMQTISNAIAFITQQKSVHVFVYVDDFFGADHPDLAPQAFDILGDIIAQLGIPKAVDKAVLPTTDMVCLGTGISSTHMHLYITRDCVQELMFELERWHSSPTCSKKALQRLLGKLNFVSSCVRPGRLFVSRLLAFLSHMLEVGFISIHPEYRLDIKWWYDFLPTFNGVSLLWLEAFPEPDVVLATDCTMQAAGALCCEHMIRGQFPSACITDTTHISQLELCTVLWVVAYFQDLLAGKYVKIFCDNEASVACINSGRCWDTIMLALLRSLMAIMARRDIKIKAVHLPRVDNRLLDALSRSFSSEAAWDIVHHQILAGWDFVDVDSDSFIFPAFY